MATATYNGRIVAQSDQTVVVEGNHYFPPDSVVWDAFTETDRTTGCPWKGTANYYHVVAGGERNEDAAWVYRTPKDAAKELTDHVAFWRGVRVEA